MFFLVWRFNQYKSIVIFVGFPMISLDKLCIKFALVFLMTKTGMSQNCTLQKTNETTPRDCYLSNPCSTIAGRFNHLFFSALPAERIHFDSYVSSRALADPFFLVPFHPRKYFWVVV